MADPVKAIADAVLYEGYILWPYRRSALKNQRRFTFGGVYPPAHSARHPDDPSSMRAEVLVRGPGGVEVTVRFLQIVQRIVLGADGEPVEQRVVDGELHLSWEEAVEREVRGPGSIAIASGREREGFLQRTWERLEGEVQVESRAAAHPADAAAAVAGPRGGPGRATPGLHRLTVTVRNRTAFSGDSREEALKRTFCSTHVLLRIPPGGEFVSLTDPPPELAGEAAACRNVGCWPVLVGEPGDATTMLASPIILEDHPRIAPESPGDLFDGGEIDQLLLLNILALTDEEQAEMAASDPRAREILERAQGLTAQDLMRLHGRTVVG